MKNWVFLILTAALVGCVSPWKQFYRENNNAPLLLPHESPVRMVRVKSSDELTPFFKDRYAVIGSSSFNGGGNVTLEDLKTFAEEKAADLVVYWTENQTSTQHLVVDTDYTPAPSQTYVSGYVAGGSYYGTANTYGGGGNATTTVTPVTVIRRDYTAVFLRKADMAGKLGFNTRDLKPGEAQKLQTNSAVYILYVTNGLPVARADVLDGDYLLEIDGQKVESKADVSRLTRAAGSQVTFKIWRNGQIITKRFPTGR
jgi:PDZ domain